jgi:uncharacterized membrane protein YfcA
MEMFDINFSGEPGMAIIAIVAFGAGLVRGFTGFGGPAFILAILTLFFTPFSIVSKILVVDFVASIYLFKVVYREIDWRSTAFLVIPTLLAMPLGLWLLVEMDPLWMKRSIAAIIAVACAFMLLGFRYRKPLTTAGLIVLGLCAGIVFGGSYIALVAVVVILLGPYNKHQGRTLIISWSTFTVLGFALLSAASGTTGLDDIVTAAPGAATYLFGTWLGSHGFHIASDKLFRRGAIAVLLCLALVNLIL